MSGPPRSGAAVDVIDVTTGYRQGQPVFDGLSVTIPDRGITHVRGRNGSGKSTLLELCSGYLRPWSGSVLVGGLPAASPAARDRRRICRTRTALYPHMTVRDHLIFSARCFRIEAEAATDRARRFGLEPWFEADSRTLSTGNARKLWIVLCTLGDFRTVFLDEPFLGLDADGGRILAADLGRWSGTGAVILISHDLPDEVEVDHQVELSAAVGQTRECQ
ncbi:ATP-binding cassette domain-containing protein [Solwaraspora sp. WMMD1047]|uniref:ABC transporter ATP-binding protein n=1 Tax=Solwaraspora sp. WMMD1047 TaxID=3016102 RepID=UPI0024167BE3|nr:ATP-binding cassette domain-containing protein [Solwaraspora sp. WMMD1047]MDG4832685.1 ATP-binding cassette domain-containing protein [Solwaraspora sp. WMMD1047]